MGKILQTPALSVFEQMALDEELARAPLAEPLLRFYRWTPGPAVTFGYAQFYDFVRRDVPAQAGPLCRRPTGGGLVLHGQDLTFSVLFASTQPRPKEIYARLHAAIEAALDRCGVLHAHRQGAVPKQAYWPQSGGSASGCFVNPVQDDLLCGDQKILGGALRRFGRQVLYQGSLQCAQARENPLFAQAVAAGLAEALQTPWEETAVPAAVLTAARQLAHTQYATPAWNEKF